MTAKILNYFFIVTVLAVLAISAYFFVNTTKLTTDKAYVQAHIIKIIPEVNGNVKSLNVHDFEKIKQDQVLFKLDDTPFKLELMHAKANLASIETRNSVLSDIDVAQARINAMQAIEQLTKTTIKAPCSGYIEDIKIINGQHIQAEKPTMTLIDNSTWWIKAYFPENKLRFIKPGQNAMIKLKMYPDIKLTGVVTGISMQKQHNTFPVYIRLNTNKLSIPLRVGQQAHVDIH